MAVTTQPRALDLGIPEAERSQIVEGLSRLLADSYTLYLKTHNFHWNVTGHQFQALHLAFEQHYTELALAVDEIAERIRALGAPAPGTYRAFQRLASVPEAEGVPAADDMVRLLVEDHETVIRTCRGLVPLVEEAKDVASADLLARRVQVHEKTAWMLRSYLG